MFEKFYLIESAFSLIDELMYLKDKNLNIYRKN